MIKTQRLSPYKDASFTVPHTVLLAGGRKGNSTRLGLDMTADRGGGEDCCREKTVFHIHDCVMPGDMASPGPRPGGGSRPGGRDGLSLIHI